MDYQRHYNLLVNRGKLRDSKPAIIEKHHILPKSMGGNNSKENIVYLTPKEHFIAHHLLWKIHRTSKMHYAFWLMITKCSNDNRREYKITSRVYHLAKEQHKIEVSKVHKGKIRTEEEKQKSSISLKGKPAWNKGMTGIYSDETIKKMSESRRLRTESEETKKKKSTSAKLRPMPDNIHSEESRRKREESNRLWIKQNQALCPYCYKTGVIYNMKRYHFDNCKNKENNSVRG